MMLRRLFAGALSLALVLSGVPAWSSQNTLQMPTTGTVSGLQFSNDVTDALDSLATCNAGTVAPTNAAGGAPKAGQCWIDTSSATLLKKYRYSGSAWVLEGAIDVTNGIWAPPVGGGTATIASATTTSICGSTTPQGYIVISGTTTITSLGTGCPVGQTKVLRFSGALTLTYDATALILPSTANIATATGDTALAVSEGSGNWRIALYSPATGQAVINPALPLGSVTYYTGLTAPTKYALGYGQTLARASFPDYLAAVTSIQSAVRTSGSPTLTGLTDTSGMGAGMPVEGTGIPSSTTISAVVSSTSLTLSANATTSGTSNVTVFATGYGTGGDSTTVGVADCRGRMFAGRDDMGGSAASRITSAGSSIVGTQLLATGGAQNVTISAANVPQLSVTITDPGHTHAQATTTVLNGGGAIPLGANSGTSTNGQGGTTLSATTGITATANTSSANTALNKMPPVAIANCIVRVLP